MQQIMENFLKHSQEKEEAKERCHKELLNIIKEHTLLMGQYLQDDKVNKET